MKQMILLCLLFITLLTKASPIVVTQVVLKAFKENFPKAHNISWHESNNKYIASFHLSKVAVIALYDESGVLIRTQKSYTEEYLPSSLQNAVKKEFSGKQIYKITEVSSKDYLVYEIILKDDACWYKIWSDTFGRLTLHEKLTIVSPQ